MKSVKWLTRIDNNRKRTTGNMLRRKLVNAKIESFVNFWALLFKYFVSHLHVTIIPALGCMHYILYNLMFWFWQPPGTSFISTTYMESFRIAQCSERPWSAVHVTKRQSPQKIGFVCLCLQWNLTSWHPHQLLGSLNFSAPIFTVKWPCIQRTPLWSGH